MRARVSLSLLVVVCAGVTGACARNRAASPAPPPAVDPSSERALPSGRIVGFAESDEAQAWLGIPFAKPPVGALRWRAPQRPEPWQGTREALRFGAACPQLAGILGDAPDAPKGTVTGSEDCLYLNVYAPRASAEAALQQKHPVLVWLHGGGNTVGHAGSYDGSVLAAAYGVVVVTTNYRLGPFGWFRHPALVAEAADDDDRSGDFGTLDQIAALDWVRANIAAFGGDPGNVTLFGESAGGTDVFSLLVSPRAAGLFQRAISESGGVSSVSIAEAEGPGDGADEKARNSATEAAVRVLFAGLPREQALEQARALAPAELASRLRAASPAQVFAAYGAKGENEFGGMLRLPMLVRDGRVLPVEEGEKLFAAGRYHAVPVILGSNRDEIKLFTFGDRAQVRWWLGFLPRAKDASRYDVTAEYASLGWKRRGVDEPAAAMRAAQGPSVYVYRFDWDEEPALLWSDFGKLLGAAHGMEIPFVFRRFEGSGFARLFTEKNRAGREELANAMSSYWAQFAYTGSPARGRSGQLAEWKPWDLADGGDKMMVLDTSAGGGQRMDAQSVTKASLLAKLASDPRVDAALRCELFRGMVEHDAVAEADGEQLGCPAAGVAAR